MRPAYSSQGDLQCSLCQRATSSPVRGLVRWGEHAPQVGVCSQTLSYKKGCRLVGYLSCASKGRWGTGWGQTHVMM